MTTPFHVSQSLCYSSCTMSQQQHPNPSKAQLIHESSIVERQRQLAEQVAKHKQRAAEPVTGETDQQRLLRLALQAKKHATEQQQDASTTGKKKRKKKTKRNVHSGISQDSIPVIDLLGDALSTTTSSVNSKEARKTNVGLTLSSSVAPAKKIDVGCTDVVDLTGKSKPDKLVTSSSSLVSAKPDYSVSSSSVYADKTLSTQTHKRPTMKRTNVNATSLDESVVSSSKVLKRARIMKKSDTSGNDQAYHNRLTKITIDDFWRAVRSWDFQADIVADLEVKKASKNKKKTNRATALNGPPAKSAPDLSNNPKVPADDLGTELSTPSQRPSIINSLDENDEDEDEEGELSEAVPDTFSSSSEYINIWSPLLIDEMKANLLSEVQANRAMNSIDWCNLPKGCNLKVNCAPLMRDVGTSTNYLTVQLRPKQQNEGQRENGRKEYIVNDIVLLVGPKTQAQQSLVGHVEHSRKSVDGLMIKVSRELWTSFGCEEMYLIYLGCNVTAIREYTSLSRVNAIPILNELLAGKAKWSKTYAENKFPSALKRKGQVKKARVSFSEDLIMGPFTEPPGKETSEHISKLGGVEALGKGWVEYATGKFNPSQLEAISAAATDYGSGGFTLIKGPPGTGKTTTLVALLNALHIKQYHKYHEKVRGIISQMRSGLSVSAQNDAIKMATKSKPRLLVCAPSNAAVDNIILKIMQSGFVDGSGMRYNPSMIRVGSGQSEAVKDVALELKVENILEELAEPGKLQNIINAYRLELERHRTEITKCQRRLTAIENATPYALPKHWEIRCDEKTFENSGRIYFVNHREKTTTFNLPPPPKSDEKTFNPSQMPEHRKYTNAILKHIERYHSISAKMSIRELVLNSQDNSFDLRSQLETDLLDSAHIVLTTLGSAGSKALEICSKFEVVVVDEAAQSIEPSTLSALELGSSHAVLVGDPQQLPATIFSLSGRKTKFDRSLFQRLEEAGHPVHMLNMQYRMNPAISLFPRSIFYSGNLKDGPNVLQSDYGEPLQRKVLSIFKKFQPLTIFNLDSNEQRSGTSLSNTAEATLALDLCLTLNRIAKKELENFSIAIITPYSQQLVTLKQMFKKKTNNDFLKKVEINTVDAFQGREADIVIFSCVRAAGSKGIGFLSDVRRMNVGLTRAKHFLFVIARVESIVNNPYWKQFVEQIKYRKAIVNVPIHRAPGLIM